MQLLLGMYQRITSGLGECPVEDHPELEYLKDSV